MAWAEQQHEKVRVKRRAEDGGEGRRRRDLPPITDPLFHKQWFLNHGARDGTDMNVRPVWEMGYTGKKVMSDGGYTGKKVMSDGVHREEGNVRWGTLGRR